MAIKKLLTLSDEANENLKKFKEKYKEINEQRINDDDAITMILEELNNETVNERGESDLEKEHQSDES